MFCTFALFIDSLPNFIVIDAIIINTAIVIANAINVTPLLFSFFSFFSSFPSPF